MAWCPKCKQEFQDGITVCSDCGSELTDIIEENLNTALYVVVMSAKEEEDAQKFLEFLKYSNIKNCEKIYRSDTDDFAITVAKEDEKEAGKLFQGFYAAEVTEKEKEKKDRKHTNPDSYDEEELGASSKGKERGAKKTTATIYVKREEKYKDLSSTASIFFIFGIGGILFLVANLIGIISFISGVLSYSIYTALFAGCIVVGITTMRSAKIAKSQIVEETVLTEAINDWLKRSINTKLLQSLDDSSLSEEANYLNRTNYIKEKLLETFQNLDESYADQLVEEFYNEYF